MHVGRSDAGPPRPRRIEVHSYSLVPKRGGALGRRAAFAQPRRGCLLRVAWPDLSAPGHADLHPWPELGDEPAEVQLAALRECEPGRLPANAARALFFARREAEALVAGRSLFSGHRPIENHLFVGGLEVGAAPAIDAATAREFRRFKVKLGVRPSQDEAEALRRLAEALPPGSRLRLDFNGRFADADEFRREWPLYARAVRERLDWIEDPLARFDAQQWADLQREYCVRFALDRGGEREFAHAAEQARSGAVRVWVLKPAAQDEGVLVESLRALPPEPVPEVCVTSYLDHPLGQLAALWVAGRVRDVDGIALGVCGLASHVAYEPTDFSDLVPMQGACIRPPLGAGWGCGERLQELVWERLR